MDGSTAQPTGLSRSLIRFGAVSALSTLVTLTALDLLVRASLAPLWANLAATAIGTLLAYDLNRRWVWGTRASARLGHVIGFLALALAGLALSSLGVLEVQAVMSGLHLRAGARQLGLQAANLAAFGSLAGLRFVLSQALFGRHRPVGV